MSFFDFSAEMEMNILEVMQLKFKKDKQKRTRKALMEELVSRELRRLQGGRTLKTHVKVNGEETNKIYLRKPYSERNKRPKCPMNNCVSKLLRVTVVSNGDTSCLGYYCKSCDVVLIMSKYKTFRVMVK